MASCGADIRDGDYEDCFRGAGWKSNESDVYQGLLTCKAWWRLLVGYGATHMELEGCQGWERV